MLVVGKAAERIIAVFNSPEVVVPMSVRVEGVPLDLHRRHRGRGGEEVIIHRVFVPRNWVGMVMAMLVVARAELTKGVVSTR